MCKILPVSYINRQGKNEAKIRIKKRVYTKLKEGRNRDRSWPVCPAFSQAQHFTMCTDLAAASTASAAATMGSFTYK